MTKKGVHTLVCDIYIDMSSISSQVNQLCCVLLMDELSVAWQYISLSLLIWFWMNSFFFMLLQVIVDNKTFALGNENIVTHNETKPWVGIHLTVPRFETKVTTKINIELGCFGLWCGLEPHFQLSYLARLRGLSYYPTNNISQQYCSTTLAYTSTGCLSSLSLKPIAFVFSFVHYVLKLI